MNFDLFYEISLPPQLGRSEAQAYADTLDEIESADRLGFGCAWLVEHHFMRGYSHSSKPELMLAALSQRTRQIRLGHAVIPLPLHHPVHVAERIATLDLLTQGRLEVGVGRGFSPWEYAVFGAGMDHSRELVDESLAILRASFLGQPVTHHGKHYHLDALDIIPHVVQQPHPPLWSAAVSPESYPWAAERELGVLAGPFKPWLMVKHDIGKYRAAWRSAATPRIGMTVGVLCLEDRKRAHAIGQQACTWFYRELFKTALPVLEKLYPSYEQIRELGRFRQMMKLGIDFGLADAAGLTVIGDPGECIAKLRKYADAGVTNLLCAFGAGAVESSVVRESLALFAREVIPAFEKQESVSGSN